MKKLIFILILSLFWRVGGFGQGDFTRIYHPIINEAELAIVDTNYFEALDFYKEAFANVKKPFAKDYYNAAICASMVGKLPLTFEYLEKIIEKGYPSDSLRKDVFFHYVADTCKRWNDFEKQMRLVKPEINWVIRDSLKKLYTLITKESYTPLTPELRKYYNEKYNIRVDTIEGKPVTYQIKFPYSIDSLIYDNRMPKELRQQQDSLRKINDMNTSVNMKTTFQKTFDLIETNGFPDETMIGLSGADTRIKNKNRVVWTYERSLSDLILNNNLTTFILINTAFSYGKELSPILIQAIRDGKLIPHHIDKINPLRFNISTTKRVESVSNFYSMGKVQVLQLQLESNLVCESAKGVANKKFWKKEKLGEYSEAEINEKRQDIGLEKLADAYKKAFFKANPTPFIINGGNYQKELSYISSCEVLEKMLKESISIR